MLVVSWNTLLRQHEEKYNPNSRILQKYSNEHIRLSEITKLIYNYVKNSPKSVICLQECSKKLIDMLEYQFTDYFIARQKIGSNEYLVTIAPASFTVEKYASHASSHGYLIVSNDTHRIINCHLIPQKFSTVNVMKHIKQFANMDNKCTIVAGDFNEKYQAVRKGLSDRYIVPKHGQTYKKKQIDYIIVDNLYECELSTDRFRTDLSDHHLISVQIE